MFRRLVATSRAPQIMVLSMLRSFGKIGPQIDQIWAWLSRGHRWSPGVRNPLKSSVTGPSLLVNCYLEIKFHKIIRVNPPPPPLTRSDRQIKSINPYLKINPNEKFDLLPYMVMSRVCFREAETRDPRSGPHVSQTTKE